MNLFELFIKIGVDDQASDKISSLSSKLGNGMKTAAKVGAAAVAAAGAHHACAHADGYALAGVNRIGIAATPLAHHSARVRPQPQPANLRER